METMIRLKTGENDVTQVCLSNNSISYDTDTYFTTGTDPHSCTCRHLQGAPIHLPVDWKLMLLQVKLMYQHLLWVLL